MTTTCRAFLLLFLLVSRAAWAEVAPDRQRELVYLLQQDCGSCHGLALLGGLGPPLTPTALREKPAALLADIVRNGVPNSAMPPWKDFLSQEEALWLTNRIKIGFEKGGTQ